MSGLADVELSNKTFLAELFSFKPLNVLIDMCYHYDSMAISIMAAEETPQNSEGRILMSDDIQQESGLKIYTWFLKTRFV